MKKEERRKKKEQKKNLTPSAKSFPFFLSYHFRSCIA